MLTPGPLTSGSHHQPRFLIHSHYPRAASGGGRRGQELRAASVHCLPALPSAAPLTDLLRGRWRKVSSWAVSRTWRGSRTSCSRWMPSLEVRECRAEGMAWMSDVNPPPSGPLDLPRTQNPHVSSARSLPAFPAVPAGLEGTAKQCPPRGPPPWLRAGLPADVPAGFSLNVPCHLEASGVARAGMRAGSGLPFLDVAKAQGTQLI